MIKKAHRLLIWVFLIFTFSCMKEDKKDITQSPVPFNQSSPDLKVLEEEKEDSPTIALENQIPLSNDNIKTMLPEKVGLYSRTKLMSGHKESLGLTSAQAEYHLLPETEKAISIEILNGAGATGAVIIHAVQQKLMMDFEEKKTNGTSRIFTKGGNRVRETENNFEYFTEIEFVKEQRFHFLFRAHNLPASELWEFIQIAGFI
jgi:hypothetical protein